MKKLEIKTEKATLLVVDDSNWDGCMHEFVGVNYNGYKHLGKVSEITEEEWKVIVDDPFVKGIGQYVKPDNLEGWTVVNAALGVQYQKYSHISFKDYQIKTDGFSISKQYPFETATESGLSLLKANGVLFENKYQDDWDELCIWGHGDFSKDGKSSFELYTEEKQKVWSNPHVFIKVD